MKKAFQLAVILLAFLPAISFAQASRTATAWNEMNSFHTILNATFTPAQQNDFAPVKQKAASLFAAARAWQKTEVPAEFKMEETKAALKKLVIACAAVNKAVEAEQPADELKRRITVANDVYQSIERECRIHPTAN